MPLRAPDTDIDTGSRISEENTQPRIDVVACPACCSVGGSPRFIDNCDFCKNEGVVTEQQADDWPQTWGS
jgi:hypothetical protein